MIGDIDWEAFAAHLRAEGEEHILEQYPEYAEYLKRKNTEERKVERRLDAKDNASSDPAPLRERIVEKVIERQVIVMRCAYCKALTPVDLRECQFCGGPLS